MFLASRAIPTILTVALILGSAQIARHASAQRSSPTGPINGKPNLTGIWQALNTANWDIQAHVPARAPFHQLVGVYLAQPAGLGIVEGNEIPYKPEALARKKENAAKRLAADPLNRYVGDPEAKCFLPGVPRATYMPFPFQIVQGTNKILVTYEYANAARIIHMDKVDPAPVDTWMGHSVGRWDGKTLVVDVTALNGYQWLDRAGNFLTETAHVVERYTPAGPDHLLYEATIEDPSIFTRPWQIAMPLYRRIDKGMQLLDFRCVEFSEEFLYQSLRKPTK